MVKKWLSVFLWFEELFWQRFCFLLQFWLPQITSKVILIIKKHTCWQKFIRISFRFFAFISNDCIRLLLISCHKRYGKYSRSLVIISLNGPMHEFVEAALFPRFTVQNSYTYQPYLRLFLWAKNLMEFAIVFRQWRWYLVEFLCEFCLEIIFLSRNLMQYPTQ